MDLPRLEHFFAFLYATVQYMPLSREDIENVARLARIGLSEWEMEVIGRDLDAILEYVDRLQKVDTEGVPEAAPPPVMADVFRRDEADACPDAEQALIVGNFPASQGGMLKAPAVFEKPKR
jgi:aspartyl-tRNA(Asn)/glutamyl-tRNA(Gln) amidotransferase subunit C